MRFKELSKKNIKHICEVYNNRNNEEMPWEKRAAALGAEFNVSERTIRKWCAEKLGFKERQDIEIESEHTKEAKKKQHNKEKKYFLITAAQNATKINTGFFNNLLAYAEHIDAELLVIPYRYHNPTSIITENDKKQEWWDSKIIPYLTLNRHNLNSRIAILSDVKIQPTANMPLNGLEALTGDQSCIVGHPRMHMKSLPVLGDRPKLMFTTGNLTKPNFCDSKIGKISEFHSVYGAVVVELSGDKDDTYFIRQISAKDSGDFNDLYWSVSSGKITRNTQVSALIKGDIHYPSHCQAVLDRSFNELVPKLQPKEIVFHDLADFKSVNPHEENDWILKYRKVADGTGNLKSEINKILYFIDSIKQYNLVVVFSNHNDFLDRFIINADVKKNITNALEFVEYAKVLLEDKAPNGLLGYIINQKFPNVKCLGIDESHKCKGWELGAHGMLGASGSRGSIQQFKKLNTHIITGHSHGVARFDGAVQVGCNCELKQNYNHGMSDWVHSDCIIHTSDGKCQHIFYLGPNAEFTTFE